MITGRDLIKLLDHIQDNREKYGSRRANKLEKLCHKLIYNKKTIDINMSVGYDVSKSLDKLQTEYEKLKQEAMEENNESCTKSNWDYKSH